MREPDDFTPGTVVGGARAGVASDETAAPSGDGSGAGGEVGREGGGGLGVGAGLESEGAFEAGPRVVALAAGEGGAHVHRSNCGSCGGAVVASGASFCSACGAELASVELLDGGRYRLIERIGQGGMGQVFLAEDTRLRVERALKLLSLPAGLTAGEREVWRARMIQEARAAQVLCAETHHVVQVYDVGFSPERGEPFLVMERLRGETLAARLGRGRLALGAALHIGRQVAQALAVAHGRGFVHRDLKPDNVMLVSRDGRDDFVKLLDFGLVKMEGGEVSTETGRMMGTLQYMPPEQLRGLKVDARADVFSLGAVLFECIAGVRANPGTTQQEIFGVLLDRGVRSLAEVAPGSPGPLVRLVDACLKLIPEQRPKDAGAVADALEAWEALGDGGEGGGSGEGWVSGEFGSAETVESADFPVLASGATTVRGLAGGSSAGGGRRLRQSGGGAVLGEGRGGAVLGEGRGGAGLGEGRGGAALGGAAGRSGIGRVRHPRRWLLALPALVVALGVGLWWSVEPAAVEVPAAAVVAVDQAVRAVDAEVAVDAGPVPFRRPTDALPARPDATRQVEGGEVVYAAAAAGDAFAALVIDVMLAASPPPEPDIEAAERWAEAPPRVRVWLAEGVGVEGLSWDGERLRVPLAWVEAARSRRPEVAALGKVGTLLTRGDEAPVFLAVNCGRAEAGDRLLTARWKMRGYAGGACEAGQCPAGVARALQQARAVGEQLQVSVTLARRTKDGDVSADHLATRCLVRP